MASNAPAGLVGRHRWRRQWLTFLRLTRYGINNFSRNAWLTTAATAVMTVTLLIIFSTLVARNVFNDTIQELRQKVDISFYLADDVTKSELKDLENKLRSQPLVIGVDYRSKDEARAAFTREGGQELEQLEAIDALEGSNPFPASLRVKVSDPDKLNELDKVFASKDFKNAQNPGFEPSFQGERRDSINNIGKAATFTERAGLALSIIAVTISILIIFNTIRMAIFNRRDEIQMMKLIGADKNFIQGPFIVEAVMYGVLAAIITMAIAYPLVLTQSEVLDRYGVIMEPTIAALRLYWPIVVIVMMLVGAFIGVLSSFLAIRRYLKV